MISDDLYKRGYGQPLLKCVTAEQTQYIIKELHEGICDYDSGARTMTTNWKTARFCQKMHTLLETWQPNPSKIGTTLFYTIPVAIRKMGNGHSRPFLPGKRPSKIPDSSRRLFHQVGRSQTISHHYSPTSPTIHLEDIICRYGVPHTIITNNGRQFIDKELVKFYIGQGIKHVTSSVEHLQTNGQAEAANKVILVELCKRLDNAKGPWPEELVEVLWAYRCTPQSATN